MTLLGVALLNFASSEVFRSFFQIFIFFIVLGVGHGILLLPVMLWAGTAISLALCCAPTKVGQVVAGGVTCDPPPTSHNSRSNSGSDGKERVGGRGSGRWCTCVCVCCRQVILPPPTPPTRTAAFFLSQGAKAAIKVERAAKQAQGITRRASSGPLAARACVRARRRRRRSCRAR